MTTPTLLLGLAREQHRAGDYAAADTLYEQILRDNPGHIEAQHLRGILQLQQQHYSAAIELLLPLIPLVEQPADLWNQLGVAYHGAGQTALAAEAFQKAILHDPDLVLAHRNWGAFLEANRVYPEAERAFHRVLELAPGDPQANLALLRVLHAQQKWSAVVAAANACLTQGPDSVGVVLQRGLAEAQLGWYAEAAVSFEAVLHQQPDSAELWNNLSYAREQTGDFSGAEQAIRQALSLRADLPELHNTLGITLRSLGRLDEARTAFRRALQQQPTFALAELNLALIELACGNWSAGWRHYEARLPLLPSGSLWHADRLWRGEPRPAERLVIYPEQGYGDTLQFARLLPLVKAQFQGTVELACESLLREVLANVDGVDGIIGEELQHLRLEEDTWVCPIGSLPERLHLLPDALPVAPYLTTDSALRSAWRPRLRATAPEGLRVGLVWRGNRAQQRDAQRSCPLVNLREWSQIPGLAWFSLQVEAEQRQELTTVSPGWEIADYGAQIRDFADTAAILAELDLVITVDTAVAHLAGACGIPAWVLLSPAADWRWGQSGEQTPWYPSLRLWRQTNWGDWPEVAARIGHELQRCTLLRSSSQRD